VKTAQNEAFSGSFFGTYMVNSPGPPAKVQSQYESRRDFVLQPRVGDFQPTLGEIKKSIRNPERVVSILDLA
jgi:hypothetical protein